MKQVEAGKSLSLPTTIIGNQLQCFQFQLLGFIGVSIVTVQRFTEVLIQIK